MTSQITIKNSEKTIQINQFNNATCIILETVTPFFFPNSRKKILKIFFVETFVSYYLRLIWRGKAYRIRFFKKSQKFTFNFGHSHWFKLTFRKNKFQFFRMRRQSYLVTYSNRLEYFFLRDLFNNIRQYNKYTKRGLRLKKTLYKQRFGKISQVNSILHSF